MTFHIQFYKNAKLRNSRRYASSEVKLYKIAIIIFPHKLWAYFN